MWALERFHCYCSAHMSSEAFNNIIISVWYNIVSKHGGKDVTWIQNLTVLCWYVLVIPSSCVKQVLDICDVMLFFIIMTDLVGNVFIRPKIISIFQKWEFQCRVACERIQHVKGSSSSSFYMALKPLAGFSLINNTLPCFPVPVSYTHLDVYKRQVQVKVK